MKSLGAIFRPFTQCCGAPAAPRTRTSKDADVGQAQADFKSEADAKGDAAAKTDAVEPSSQHGQATDMPNAAGRLQEPRANRTTDELPGAPPPFPAEHEQALPEVAPQNHDGGTSEDAAFLPEAQAGVSGFPPEADRNVTSEAAPAPGPDGFPQPVGVPAPTPVTEPGSMFATGPAVVVHHVPTREWDPRL